MPMHDWSLILSAAYRNFRFQWLAAILDKLNGGVLPRGLFAMVERCVDGRAGNILYARMTRRFAIHQDLDTIVAVLELVSPGNKDTKAALRSFARKSAALLRNNVHLSVIDPFPPGRFDPNGIHRAIWDNVTSESTFVPPADRPLTLVAYQAGEVPTAYVDPFAVGATLPDLALFLDEEEYVLVPLEETYQATWNVLPQILRDVVVASAESA